MHRHRIPATACRACQDSGLDVTDGLPCTGCTTYEDHEPARAARLIRQAAALGLTE